MKMRRFQALALALLLGLCMMLGGCGGDGGSETTDPAVNDTQAEYQVLVVDANGEPYTSGVIVSFWQDGTQVALQPVDETGVAAKTLDKGEYTVELVFVSDSVANHYDASGVTLTAGNPRAEVVLSYTVGEQTTLYAGEGSHDAYHVGAGCTYMELTANERNYLLFAPTVAGTYEFTVVGSDEPVGYYGSVYFVQNESISEVVDNVFTVSIDSSMISTGGTGTTVLVLGIDAGSSESCILSVRRIGEPAYNVANEPWTVYQTTVELSKFELPADTKLQEFDLTADTDAYALVLDDDGYYHLNSADGPLVMMRLCESSKYIDSIEMILSRSGMSKYFYDADGNFIKKESYTESLLEYVGCADDTFGVYPLTEDLKYMIQQRGDYVGWWDPEGASFLFVDENRNPIEDINYEIAWLFMCCYADVG